MAGKWGQSPKAARAAEAPACTAAQVQRELNQLGSPVRAAGVSRFFKTGKGEYGEGDVFIGVSVGEQRLIARHFSALPLAQADKLLTSKVHEHRLTALLILVDQFEKARAKPRRALPAASRDVRPSAPRGGEGAEGDASLRRKIFNLYLKRLAQVNNWDLVDSSADPIVGGWLADKDRVLLDKLAKSRHLWTRRVAIIATFYFIKHGSADDTLRIAAALLDDRHDLIHKATGWMLREVGKRVSPAPLRAFLTRHAARMPRTMLRYAIEHFSPAERMRWLDAGDAKR